MISRITTAILIAVVISAAHAAVVTNHREQVLAAMQGDSQGDGAMAGSQRPPRACAVAINQKHPFCNTSLPLQQRVDDLISRLNDTSATLLFGETVPAINQSDLYIPPRGWWSEALHGVWTKASNKYVNSSTSFPMPCVTGATFNKTLFSRIGHAIGTEGRAAHNYHTVGLTFWAPNINIYRDPRWGRGQETPGEDPFLTSTYAHRFVYNMQFRNDKPDVLLTSSCCKHFDAYDVDSWADNHRSYFNAIVSQYDLDHTFNPPFEACYHRNGGHASGMMCSYNEINGVPMCANKQLINGLARDVWGFDGYVTSDCEAAWDVWGHHNYTKRRDESIKLELEAGMDTACGLSRGPESFLQRDLPKAMKRGIVSRSLVNTAINHTMRVLFRLGEFDPEPFPELGPSNINTQDHQDMALHAAQEGMTLLHNRDNALPLKASSFGPNARIAVMGPNANNSIMLLGDYYGTPPYVINPLDAMVKDFGDRVKFHPLLDKVLSTNATGINEACDIARNSDVVLLFVGNDQSVGREQHDRMSIAFPGVQEVVIERVASCAWSKGVKTFVVSFAGGSIDYSVILKNPGVHGLLWAGFPGQAGGRAIVDLLFGKVSPSGRMVTTTYPREYADIVPMSDMQMEANASTGNPGRTYKYYTGTPVFPFGYGLSYSNFTISVTNGSAVAGVTSQEPLLFRVRAADVEKTAAEDAPLYTVAAGGFKYTVTNHGPMAAAASVLLNVKRVHPPAKEIGGELTDFDKVFLDVGQTAHGTLQLHVHALVRIENGRRVVQKGEYEMSLDVMSQPKLYARLIVE